MADASLKRDRTRPKSIYSLRALFVRRSRFSDSDETLILETCQFFRELISRYSSRYAHCFALGCCTNWCRSASVAKKMPPLSAWNIFTTRMTVLFAFAVTLNSCRAIGNWFALRLVRETDQHASLGESEYEVYLGFIGFFLGAEPCCCRVFEGASGAGGFQGAFKKS